MLQAVQRFRTVLVVVYDGAPSLRGRKKPLEARVKKLPPPACTRPEESVLSCHRTSLCGKENMSRKMAPRVDPHLTKEGFLEDFGRVGSRTSTSESNAPSRRWCTRVLALSVVEDDVGRWIRVLA